MHAGVWVFVDGPILTWRRSEQQPQGLQRDEWSESASLGYCSHLQPAANSVEKKKKKIMDNEFVK